MPGDATTLAVKRRTKARLDKERQYGETYDGLLNKLLDMVENKATG